MTRMSAVSLPVQSVPGLLRTVLTRKALLLLPFLLLAFPQARAQIQMSVNGTPVLDAADLDAASYYRQTDVNDQVCAILKVTPSSPLNVPLVLNTGGGIAPVPAPKGQTNQRTDGSWWYWLSPDTKNIFFTAAGYQTTARVGVSLHPGKVYRLSLSVGASRHVVTEVSLNEGIFKLHIQPDTCVVSYGTEGRYDMDSQSVTDGYFEAALDWGRYDFKVESEYYETYYGSCSLAEAIHEQQVSLVPAFGRLELTTEPSGVEVFLDGNYSRPLGSTPLRSGKIARGTHRLLFSKDDYYNEECRVEVVSDGSVQTLPPLVLRPQFGTVTCICEDEEAQLTVMDAAGRVLGEGRSGMSLRVGSRVSYKVVASRPSHHSQEARIPGGTELEGRTLTVSVRPPVPILGNLMLTSAPLTAEVILDGKSVGKTSWLGQVLIGKHQVCLRMEGYQDENFVIDVPRPEGNEKYSVHKILSVRPTRRTLTVSTLDGMAGLCCDGAPLGGSNSVTAEFDIGRTYRFTAVKEGCHDGVRDVQVTEDMDARVTVPSPVPLQGTVKIAHNSTGGTSLYISSVSGERQTVYSYSSPYVLLLKPGTYRISASSYGYNASAEKSFAVEDGKTTNVSLYLPRISRFQMTEDGFASHFVDLLVGYNSKQKSTLIGGQYAYCHRHLGFYFSAMYALSAKQFGANVGPVFRLTNDSGKLDYQLYGGIGYDYGSFGGEAGMRLGWRSGALSWWDITLGVQASSAGVIPVVGVGLGIALSAGVIAGAAIGASSSKKK